MAKFGAALSADTFHLMMEAAQRVKKIRTGRTPITLLSLKETHSFSKDGNFRIVTTPLNVGPPVMHKHINH